MTLRAALLLSLAGLVACTDPTMADNDGDGFSVLDDCDDMDAAVNPDAEEVCDEVDNNCNEEVDEGVLLEFFIDSDSDGYGTGQATLACVAPAGLTGRDGDCNDANAQINPDAVEVCDLDDNNCDGQDDEGVTTTYYRDTDRDGYGVDGDTIEACQEIIGFAAVGGDCDDNASKIYPSAPLLCDGRDGDCDGSIDNDADGDGYSDEACGGQDCDDADASNFEECTPGLDPSSPGVDCLDIITVDPTAPSGLYWIDPNGGSVKDGFQAYCEMDTDGGGWTLTYLVDAEHFDGEYANNLTESAAAPTALNSQSDIWNAEQVMSFTELAYGCTTQDEASSHYWTYTDTSPHTWFSDAVGDYNYQSIVSATTDSSTATCMSTHNRAGSYGFLTLEAADCGYCGSILYGMYHYASGSSGCNNTDSTYGTHSSPWDKRSIQYPVCAGKQTSNGTFWMGVR